MWEVSRTRALRGQPGMLRPSQHLLERNSARRRASNASHREADDANRPLACRLSIPGRHLAPSACPIGRLAFLDVLSYCRLVKLTYSRLGVR
jgi:hypothetical protein